MFDSEVGGPAFDRTRRASSDNADFYTCLLQHLDAMAVTGIERFGFRAVFTD